LGTALSISSVKIVAAVVHDMNFLRRTIGQLIVASAIIDDTIGWITISVIFGLALHGRVEAVPLGLSIVGTMVFLALSLTLGQRAVAAVMRDPSLLLIAGGLILIASVGKFGGAFLGGTLAGLSRRESLALGCGMNARGSTEVIVATIGLSMGALNQTLYTMIVAMAFVTTMAMPPMLRWALARLPISPEESERLARMAASTANSPVSPRASTGRWRWWWLAALPGATRSAAASTSWCR